MSDKHWSKSLLFSAPLTVILVALILVLMFYAFKFFNTLYIELMIVIDIVGDWFNEISKR